LIVDLHDIDREGTVLDGSVVLPVLEGPVGDSVVVSEATVHAEIARGERGHDLFARFRAVAEVECSRCLARFGTVLAEEFYLTLVGRVEVPAETDHEVSEEDASLYPVPGGRLDMAEVLAEQVYLALPLKPVCRPDCRGLCPKCGANRNTGPCRCPVETRDVSDAIRPLS